MSGFYLQNNVERGWFLTVAIVDSAGDFSIVVPRTFCLIFILKEIYVQ